MSKTKKKQKTMEELLEEALVPKEEQPYEVPGNWVWVKLGTISEIIRGVSYKKHQVAADLNDNHVFIIRGGNIQDGEIINQNDNVYVPKELVRDKQFIKKGDVVIVSSTGSPKVIGKPGIIKKDNKIASFGAFIIMIRPCRTINSTYFGLYFLSHHYREKIVSLAKGSNINNIKREHLTGLYLPFPNLREQKRIADKVKRLLNKIDEAKRLIEEAKETFEHRRAAILDKAFRGELVDSRQESRNSTKALGNLPYTLPEGWTWVTLEEIIEFENGDRSSRYPKTKDLVEEGIPFLSTRELTGDIIKFDNESKYITEEIFLSLRNGKLKDNDVVMSLRGSVGKIGLFKATNEINTGFINAQLVILRSKQYILPKYLLGYLSSQIFKNFLEKVITGSAQPQLSVKALKTILCPLPPIDVQYDVVSKLDKIIKKMEGEFSIIDTIDFGYLKSSILSKAFRGELGTNDPAEESAIELLKEVLEEKI